MKDLFACAIVSVSATCLLLDAGGRGIACLLLSVAAMCIGAAVVYLLEVE